ncbi:MAG TPA: efflux RND transporter periplasmic adaptor subunit [Terriglobia bacterium]|nr:efflux RND transporter periplasmic adaptor subunit [Terriglobia bacterium]
MKSKKKVWLMIIGAVLLVALVVVGIVWSKRGQVTVQTGKVMRQDLASVVTASGQIEPPPEKLANVNANSFGKITEILVKEGDTVKKGQLLMRTEDVQQSASVDAQQAAIKTAQADIAVNSATVDSAAASLKAAQANLAQSQAKLKDAGDQFKRDQEGFKSQIISQQQYDTSLSNYEVAKAAVQSSEAQVAQNKALYQQAISNRDMADARLRQNRAQLLGVQNQLSQTVYTSPIDGIITSLPVHVGENMVPGVQNQPGSVLFQVSDLSVITAEVMVDETDIVNVKVGQPAEVTIDAVPNKTFAGKVTEIGQSAVSSTTGQSTTQSTTGASNQEAKDFKVVVTLDNPPPNMRPGLSATAKITSATRQDAIAIPIQALTIRTRRELEESQKKSSDGKALAAEKPMTELSPKEQARLKEEVQGAFVIRAGKAVFVPVETGIMGETNAEVTKGLQPGDEIVTGSYQVLRTLKDGTKVKVDNTTPMQGPTASGS